MNITVLIDNIATGAAVALGLTYILGGLVVNLNLARRGLLEFEILKTKYLVVGLVFLLHSMGVFTFAALPAFALLLASNDQLILEWINVLSMLAAISLFLIWMRYPSDTKSWLGDWWYWFAASSIGAIFPMLILLHQLLGTSTAIIWIIFSAQAVLTGALTFLAQIYHYSAFYYGRLHGLGSLDPIGVGVPSRVRLVGAGKDIPLLKATGLPVKKNGVSEDVYLIDETSAHYIVAFQREARQDENTLKLDKSLIKAILFRPTESQRGK